MPTGEEAPLPKFQSWREGFTHVERVVSASSPQLVREFIMVADDGPSP